MAVEVRLDGRRLYRSTFPACRVNGSDLSKQGGRVLRFSFQAGRPIVWSGYGDDHETTQPPEELEGNIWEAGGEASRLLLGVSFSTRDKIMMNTIHVAGIASTSQSEIANGLLVVTSPAKKRAPVPHD